MSILKIVETITALAASTFLEILEESIVDSVARSNHFDIDLLLVLDVKDHVPMLLVLLYFLVRRLTNVGNCYTGRLKIKFLFHFFSPSYIPSQFSTVIRFVFNRWFSFFFFCFIRPSTAGVKPSLPRVYNETSREYRDNFRNGSRGFPFSIVLTRGKKLISVSSSPPVVRETSPRNVVVRQPTQETSLISYFFPSELQRPSDYD